jgi:hypothetical protein
MRCEDERRLSSVMAEANGAADLCFLLSLLEGEWKSIVGGSLGARSAPLSYEGGVLVVAVNSPSAFQDMNFRKNAIIREICSRASLAVRDIKVKNGAVRGADFGPASHRAVFTRRAAAPDEKKVKSVSDDILSRHSDMDPDLARVIARCMVMCER